jgi:ubiquinone/menaquinone biosynthesis C-methylase UbiE
MSQQDQERVMQNIYKTWGNDAYKMLEFVGAISGPLASRMLQQIRLDKATVESFKLLDNGAGFGIVAAEIQRTVNRQTLLESSIISADFSESAVEFVKRRIESEGWINTEARVVDAQVGGPASL